MINKMIMNKKLSKRHLIESSNEYIGYLKIINKMYPNMETLTINEFDAISNEICKGTRKEIIQAISKLYYKQLSALKLFAINYVRNRGNKNNFEEAISRYYLELVLDLNKRAQTRWYPNYFAYSVKNHDLIKSIIETDKHLDCSEFYIGDLKEDIPYSPYELIENLSKKELKEKLQPVLKVLDVSELFCVTKLL